MWSDPSRDYHPGPLPLEHAGPARAVETFRTISLAPNDHILDNVTETGFDLHVVGERGDSVPHEDGIDAAAVAEIALHIKVCSLEIRREGE